MERQRLLQILHESIENKTRLLASKRVVSVIQTDREAIIVSEDGSELGCDFVAGADGVRSIVRREIEKGTFTSQSPESRKSSVVTNIETRMTWLNQTHRVRCSICLRLWYLKSTFIY